MKRSLQWSPICAGQNATIGIYRIPLPLLPQHIFQQMERDSYRQRTINDCSLWETIKRCTAQLITEDVKQSQFSINSTGDRCEMKRPATLQFTWLWRRFTCWLKMRMRSKRRRWHWNWIETGLARWNREIPVPMNHIRKRARQREGERETKMTATVSIAGRPRWLFINRGQEIPVNS